MDDDEVEIVGDVDVTMGSSDGPVTAASGAEAVRICLFFRFYHFSQPLVLSDGHR